MSNTIVLELEVNDSAHAETNQLSAEDLSTRDRILRAAIGQFGEHGFRGASIRGIAAAAGVSAGLVQHHFGTKDGLREACDDWVMSFLKDTQFQMLRQGAPPTSEEMASRLDDLQPMIDYLILSLSSGSETAAQWFREISEYTHETLLSGRMGPALDPETQDTRMIAATITAMALGVTAFYRTIQQALEVENEAEMVVRVGRARLFLASENIVGQTARERLAEALDQYEQSKVTGKPPPGSSERPNE